MAEAPVSHVHLMNMYQFHLRLDTGQGVSKSLGRLLIKDYEFDPLLTDEQPAKQHTSLLFMNLFSHPAPKIT